MLGCLDVKDAVLQVSQAKPWNVKIERRRILGEEELTWTKLEQKHGLTFSLSTPPRNSITSVQQSNQAKCVVDLKQNLSNSMKDMGIS